MSKELYLVCNAHLDPVWMWDWEEGAATALATFYAAAELCEEYDFIFCHNEAILYEYIEAYAPELFARIKRLAAAGRWRIIGGWYLQPDCNMPCGEAFVRQISLGRAYFQEKFGVTPTTAINFDSFGHTRGLVQILAKNGYDSYIVCRPMPDLLELPAHHFRWMGLDGSAVDVVRSPSDSLYCTPMGQAAESLRQTAAKWDGYDAALLLWGVGNHGGGPSRGDLRDIEDWRKVTDDTVLHSYPEAFFARHRPGAVFAGSLNPCLVKCYSSMNRIKQKNIALENRLLLTEKLCALAALNGKGSFAFDAFHEAERMLCSLAFHDVLPGDGGPQVEQSGLRKGDHALELLSRQYMQALFALTRDETPAGEGEFPLFLFNPCPYALHTEVEGEFLIQNALVSDDEHYTVVVRQRGREVPSQVIKELTNLNYDRRKRIAVRATLSPMSINRFDVAVQVVPNVELIQPQGDILLEDGCKRVRISRRTGLLTGYCVGGREYLDGGAFEPVLYDDTADPYGWGRFCVGDNPTAFRLSACEKGVFAGQQNVRVIEDGDVLTTVESLFECASSAVRLSYTIYKELPYIDVIADVFWNEADKALKLRVPVAMAGDFIGQIAYGSERFPQNGEEQPLQRFAAIIHGEDALAVYNDCIYGHSAQDGSLLLTLLNGSAYAAHPIGDRPLFDRDQFHMYIEFGRHTFRFRLNAANRRALEKEALEFTQRTEMLNIFPHGIGDTGKQAVTLSNPAIALHVFKKSETGGYILRLFNNLDEPAESLLRAGEWSQPLSFGPFEVKTVRLEDGRLQECDRMEI